MEDELIRPNEAAKLKGVTRGAIYLAIAEGRLSHTRVLGHLALRKADVLAWTPMKYVNRPGRPQSEETKERISEAQKRRWATRKQQNAKSTKKDSE